MRHCLSLLVPMALLSAAASIAACGSSADRDFAQSGGAGGSDAAGATGGMGAGGGGGSSGSGGSGASGSGGGGGASGSGGTGGASVDSGIACEGGLSPCGATCVDTGSDPQHCGRCDHDCLGGACELGVCQSVTIEVGQYNGRSIAVDATHVYWGRSATSQTPSSVSSKRIDGSGAIVPIAADETGSGLSIANGQIYWMFKGAVRTCPAPDCASGASNFASSTGTTAGDVLVAESVSRIYFGEPSLYNSATGALWYAPLLGGAAQKVPGAPTNPQDIVSDGTNLFWVNSSTYTTDSQNSDGKVLRMPLAGGTIVPLADGLRGDISDIAVAGGAVYFGGRISIGGVYTAGIFKLPLPNGVGSGAPPRFAELAPRGMVADDDYLYFTSENEVYRCPHSGCSTPPEVFAPGQTSPSEMAQDAVSIYWTNNGTLGTTDTAGVRRLAK